MTQRRFTGSRTRLPHWQALLLLLVFLAVRGLVPAGYMPAPLSSGNPYGLCHGDPGSAQLLQWLAQRDGGGHSHHSAHQHDALTAQTFADNHCSFSAGAVTASAPAVELPSVGIGILPALPAGPDTHPHRRAYLRPLGRAPPLFPFA